MKITVTVKTQAEIQPTKPLSTLELYNLAKTVAGNTLSVTIEDSDTVQQLADAADKLMNVDPALTIKEKVVEHGNTLDLTATLAAAGVADGDVVTYSYVIIA